MRSILALLCLLLLPTLAPAAPSDGLLPGSVPRLSHRERERHLMAREDRVIRHEVRREQRRERRAWRRYERPRWEHRGTVRRQGQWQRLDVLPRQRDTR